MLLATGAADELPDVAGARERWGRDLLHCPYCHGWEVRDQPLGVLATGPGSVDYAHLLRQWTDDVILFTHTHADHRRASARRSTLAGSRSSTGRSSASSSATTACERSSSPAVAASRAPPSSSARRCARTAHGPAAALGCELDRGRARPGRRRRAHERARRLGGRQRRQPAGPGDHRRGRRLRGRHRHQHRARRRRRRPRRPASRRGHAGQPSTTTRSPMTDTRTPADPAAQPAPARPDDLALRLPDADGPQRGARRPARIHVAGPPHVRPRDDRRADRDLRADAAPAPRPRPSACRARARRSSDPRKE